MTAHNISGCTVGVDIGSTTVKLVCLDAEKHIIATDLIRNERQVKDVDSAFVCGVVESFIGGLGLAFADLRRLVLTGVGSGFVDGEVGGILPLRANELESLGRGGLYLSGLQRALVVSLGTGSTFVLAEPGKTTHLGGTALGAAALEGLCRLTVGESDAANISRLAAQGDLKKIDLIMEDISKDKLSFLPMSATAAHFGKVRGDSAPADVARAVINLVCQNVALFAVFTGRGAGVQDIVLTGGLTAIEQTAYDFGMVGRLYGYNFITPPHAVFAVVIGACLCYM